MKAVNGSAHTSLRRDMAELLSSYTHDATNPLINLESLLQYLQRQTTDLKIAIDGSQRTNIEHLIGSAIPQTIDMMFTSSRQMRNMNNALNQLYHCHCDDLDVQPVNLNELVDDIIKQGDIAPHIHFSIDALPTIMADYDAMHIIFTALISNAVNSIHSDEISMIEIFCEQQKDALYIHVKDHGCGLIAEEVDEIYTAFYRGMKSKGQGLGIGLSMAQVLLHRYHGRITCETMVNGGSTFTIIWPEQ